MKRLRCAIDYQRCQVPTAYALYVPQATLHSWTGHIKQWYTSQFREQV